MDYIFSKEERNLYKISLPASCVLLGIIVAIMTIVGIVEKQGIYFWISEVTIGVIFIIPIILNVFIYRKYQFSKYEFTRGEVCNFIKNKKRIISRGEEIVVSVVPMRLGRGHGSYIVENFVVIGRKGTVLPDADDELSPYVAMRKFDIVLLPCNEEIFNKIYVSLGILVNYM
ncbi:MAG: hypothetical protein IJX55_06790 [Clostridia bacterium]|nr:hypothetical protein [Clostridia bacterium]